jgi:GNAT superfamily N-acetyltransferase
MTDVRPLAEVLLVRDAAPEDRGYVARSWMETYRNSPLAKSLGGAAYSFGWGRVVTKHLDASRCEVACLKDDPRAIVGFIVYELPTQAAAFKVHYLCVRDTWRRQGVASMLVGHARVPDVAVKYSHTASHEIPVPKGWTYAPEHHACIDWLRDIAEAVDGAGLGEAAAVIRGLAQSVDRLAYRVRRVAA